MERKHSAEKAERRDSSVTAARYKNKRGLGLHWTNLSALPSVLLWASLAHAQASVVDILLQSNCLEDMRVSQGLAKRQFAPTTHFVISVAGHDGSLPIPLLRRANPYSFFFFFPHPRSLCPVFFSPQDHLFWAQLKHTWLLAQALNHMFFSPVFNYYLYDFVLGHMSFLWTNQRNLTWNDLNEGGKKMK